MTWLPRVLFLALATLATAVCQTESGNPAAGQTTPAGDVFSGVVTALAADSVTVVRKVPAKADVARKFLVDSQTKMEGPPMKVSARVTVRYQAAAEGQLQALYIIVR